MTSRSYRPDDVVRLARLSRAAAVAVAPGPSAGIRQALVAAATGSPVFARILGRHHVGRLAASIAADAGSPAAPWNRLIDELPTAQRALFT